MPQQYGETPTNTFIGGLITEAGELTFPQNASIDELNCDLLRDGSRRRRLGIEVESAGSLSTETDATGNAVVSVNRWLNVGEQAGTEFVVVQSGSNVWFYEVPSSGNLSDQRVDTSFTSGVEYSLDLLTYERPASVNGAASAPIQASSLKGGLVIASPEINTILITRDATTGNFTVTEIDFFIRDYQWQGDTTTYDTLGVTNTNRSYDTLNAGWASGPLSTYTGAKAGQYPPLTLPWYAGKDASGNFSVSEWEKVWSGNTLITNGHYVIDLYTADRDSVSGLSGVSASQEDARFSTVAGYSGRMFYSGMINSTADNGSKVFFSGIMTQGFVDIGRCHQVNDPTAEDVSDLLDTDGGYISIPEAHNIRRLHVFGAKIFVIADNGVWAIGGVDDVFRATDYTVTKVSEEGIASPQSFVSASGRPYWWSNAGIYTLTSDQVGNITAENISIGTIQSFWENIGSTSRATVQAAFDVINRRVFWCYQTDTSFDSKLNGVLIFDEPLNAFFPWKFEDSDTDPDWVVGLITLTGAGSSSIDYQVVDSSNNPVVDSSGNNVVVNREGRELSSSRIKFLVRDGATGSYTFAEVTGTDFLDWGDADYSSYAESSYDFMGSLEQRKNIPYITTFLKTTETGWVANGDGYDPVRESSCKLSCYWDFKKVPGAVAQEVYRRKYIPVVDTSDLTTFDYPTTVIISRIKPRGRGRVARFRWESVTGKDFHILGWSAVGALNGRF